jgi:NAD+ synthase (glutamine-hydrolysing)
MNKHGFARIAVCSPKVAIGNPVVNRERIAAMAAEYGAADVVAFPELSITGYTCGNLFQQQTLLDSAEEQVAELCKLGLKPLVIVGVPVRVGSELFNCAIVLQGSTILGIVPKQNIPNYSEFYERRWFAEAVGGEPETILYAGQTVPFGIDLLFAAGDRQSGELVVFVEICEDLWMPVPPSSLAAIAGANLLVNLSASTETVAKDEYRMELVRNQSGRCLAGYAYACSGPSESTSDMVFAGHCMIAENNTILAQTDHIGDGSLNLAARSCVADIDVQKLQHDRLVQGTFGSQKRLLACEYRTIDFAPARPQPGLARKVAGYPFVPSDPAKLVERCAGVFDIQCAGFARRWETLGFGDVFLGVSGGLDSTQMLLVLHRTASKLDIPLERVHAITMPGFGTTSGTLDVVTELCGLLGVSFETIDIRPQCMQMYRDLKHRPFGIDIAGMTAETFQESLRHVPKEKRCDLVFENVQARMRTAILMNRGFVAGTGDMSELALKWCTYNGDHMSMYNANCGVPKTLMKFMVETSADAYYIGRARECLRFIANLVISPELLPFGPDGQIEQSTEDVLGPYPLHDFYLFNMVRNGFGPEKMLWLAAHSELQKYEEAVRVKTLKTFIERFFMGQFTRNCVPDGPKVGTVALSPRGDWRMPSDADADLWKMS